MLSSLSHSLLVTQIILVMFIISPLPIKYKTIFLSSRPFNHVISGLLLMVLFSFLDSTIRLRNSTELLYYYSERNCILSGISLFLLIVFKRLIHLFQSLDFENQSVNILKKQIQNQKEFVEKLLKEHSEFEKKLKEKNKEIEQLNEKIKKDEILVKQVKNNQEEYFKLLDKYNNLKYSYESKKNI